MMGFLKNSASTVLLAVALLAGSLSVSAFPANPFSSLSPSRLIARGLEGNLGSLGELVMAVKEYLATKNAYDPDVPGKCVLALSTSGGTNCQASLQCDMTDADGPEIGPQPWNACYLGGRQYFYDPDIGNFSVTFTEAGGVNGNTVDGLHTPVLQMENLNNWEPIDIESVVKNNNGEYGNLCWSNLHTSFLDWGCGLPKINQAAFGISNYNPANSNSYTPGVCGLHVVQYQRNEPGVGNDYAFDVVIYDSQQKEIGIVQKASIDSTTKQLDVTSALPYVVILTAPGGDQDNIDFAYAGQTWQCGDGKTTENGCDLGVNVPRWGYENGDRKGDMHFNC